MCTNTWVNIVPVVVIDGGIVSYCGETCTVWSFLLFVRGGVVVWSRVARPLPPHVGYVHQCIHKHEPCGFSTFFSVSVATNVTARVTPRTNFQ